MSREQKRAYLEAIRKRYKQAKRKQKAIILDEFCKVCGYNRKYAIRLLHKRPCKKKDKPGRKPYYPADKLLIPLKAIWFASDQMGSKRLQVVIKEWLPFYEQDQGSYKKRLKKLGIEAFIFSKLRKLIYKLNDFMSCCL